jgi:hypothetical protein
MSKSLKVGIVGGSIAGCSAAILMFRAGAENLSDDRLGEPSHLLSQRPGVIRERVEDARERQPPSLREQHWYALQCRHGSGRKTPGCGSTVPSTTPGATSSARHRPRRQS